MAESIEYQRLAWEALKKSLTGLTNKVNSSNIAEVAREIFKQNVIRGRGVLVRAIMQAQAMSPTFTHVYAALVAIINCKFPNISELLLKRLIIQFERGYRVNDKRQCVSSTRFIAHLLNQEVAHEILVLEILTILLENPTDDSVEIAISMLKECGQKLSQLSNKGVLAIFERLKHILHEAKISKRVQYMIQNMYAVRKDKFKDYPSITEELDLVHDADKHTHMITLDDVTDAEDKLNVFQFDPEYLVHEQWYKDIQEGLGEESGSDGSGASGSESDSDDGESEGKKEETTVIHDMTETGLVALRRNIYLTIQSSLTFQECAHKLLEMEFNPGQIVEMCYMILDCCAQQRSYDKFYGLLAQRFCELNKIYVESFTEIFKNSYETIHRLETNKLRNVAKFFAYLLYTDAISWMVLSNIKLNEDDTTSSNRIFIKILFQDLAECMCLTKLFERVKDVTMQEAFDGIFPRDNPQNTRFAINFFTSIGLGGLTDELREHLKTMPKTMPLVANPVAEASSDSDSSSSSSLSSTSSSSSSSSSSEEGNDSRRRNRGRKYTNSRVDESKSRPVQRTNKNRISEKKTRKVKDT